MILEMRTAKITEKGQIAIPKEIREMKGFQEGEKIAVLAYKDHVELRPLKAVSEKIDFTKPGMQTALASEKVLGKDWLSKEEEQAWKDL
ncbi:AbrB/MazE/SpoVT family DNA-binding domain-containing protein [Candidatus Woesearchaeota archaeon]|nr:AbrB/MazE/SpoVT family DNA-binding domain-containing protein [Candidatus Woesearchaeota archaeon]